MSRLIDITGKKVGKLTVIKKGPNDKGGRPLWICQCECGNMCLVSGQRLRAGTTNSCGCLRHVSHTITHGMSSTRLYYIWSAMKARCNQSKHHGYKDYGGRGIHVCDEWFNSFEAFAEWSINNGYEENLSIDRIDNDGNYCPENCRWATRIQQENNKRKTLKYTYNGETKGLAEWCHEYGLNYNTTYQRLFVLGHPFEEVINLPVNVNLRYKEERQKWLNT